MKVKPGEFVLAPSLLAADFSDLKQAKSLLKKEQVKVLHLDIMDGHFVPNISFGPPVIKGLQDWGLFLDCHLMVSEPSQWIDPLVDLGVDQITVHVEAEAQLRRTLGAIKERGVAAGVALNPHTSIESVQYCLDLLDTILVMTVNPGFGGQKFIPQMIPKLKALSQLLKETSQEKIWLAVDGGVDDSNLAQCHEAGARFFVAGSSFFSDKRRAALLEVAKEYQPLS